MVQRVVVDSVRQDMRWWCCTISRTKRKTRTNKRLKEEVTNSTGEGDSFELRATIGGF